LLEIAEVPFQFIEVHMCATPFCNRATRYPAQIQ
jgi:hypothetical protein